ncbi:hypothetical protein GIB67_030266 [Kingdonia uniflora]|uniref:Beta-taxilin n=1 Tax=Kingdonia uniflora TaxID=39325 RepID=A0A7J7M6G4_9MAGN|nr:hypothetical protein GIB67_030266 [Kingdonia uniflora]
MEKNSSSADQLPEADSLPDGFVESSPESSTTTTFDRESNNDEETEGYKDEIIEPDPSHDTVLDLPSSSLEDPSVFSVLTDKLGTFSVALSENDGSNSAAEAVTAIEGPMELQTTSLNVGSVPESAEPLKNRKIESTEVKRKTAKRGFKTEQEFLEFTLKYQQVVAERDGAIIMRNKLESLCRELQRQNKTLMDECKRVSTEGQNMREELSTKFHDAIKDVSIKLEGQKDECLEQLKDNEMLRNKLKHLCDQYTISEQQFTQKLKQKTLELQLADLKIQQHEEKLTHEQSQMKFYAEQVTQLLTTEKTLRVQLAADGEKFKQFQDALLKSNEIFETFKQEIEKMAKSIKELKKENIFLKGKSEKSDVTLIELVEELYLVSSIQREHLKKQMEKVKNQKEKLESLCRSLQLERKHSSIGNNISDPVPIQSKIGSSGEES